MPRPSGTWAIPARATASGPLRFSFRPPRTTSPLRRTVPGDRAQRCRLARAVRAEQGDDLAFADGQRDAMQRDDLPVAGRDVVELEQRRHLQSTFMVVEIEEGIRRATFSLPFGLDHVHCYFLRSSNGGWILVDTGLGSRTPEERWRPVLDELDAPVEKIVVTHMHPDHVGGARDIAELTGAPVLQGREDYEQCVRAWGEHDPQRFVDYWVSHGMPSGRSTRCCASRRAWSTLCIGCAIRNSSTTATRWTGGACWCCAAMRTGTSSSSVTGC